MNNSLIKRKVVVEITGKSPERFILRLKHNKINIYKLKKIKKDKYEITIDYSNFEKILKIKTIYELKIIRYLGIEKTKRQILKYYHLLLALLFSIIGLYIFSNIITKVEIITNDVDMKQRLIKTLGDYQIKKNSFKKNYDYLNNVKKNILEKYHDEIEWIEIEKKGTIYIVKYEPRIIKEKDKKKKFGHIVARKNAIVRKVFASQGQIIKNKFDYVKKGDIVISGYIYANEKIKKTVSSSGKVYGEVWYTTKVTYPFNYYEQKKTGNIKNVYSIKFINNRFDIFNFHPFNDKIINERVLIKNNLIPFRLVKEKQEEVIIKSSMNVIEEVKLNAIDLAYEKINEQLDDDEYIINHKVLDSKIIDKGIEMKLFFSVCENIGNERSGLNETYNG